jgi:heme oxygenase
MNFSEQLKSATRSFHSAAEGQNFQRLLANALLPVDLYASYLGQLFFVHQALEEAIEQYSKTDKRLKEVVLPEQIQEGFLRNDLIFLGTAPETMTPLPATSRLRQEIAFQATNNPLSLLGFHYVLLGSKHGGKLIAKNIKERYQFDASGTQYFNPYGENFMPCWQSFIKNLNQLERGEADQDDVIKAAQAMFSGIGEIGTALENIFEQRNN